MSTPNIPNGQSGFYIFVPMGGGCQPPQEEPPKDEKGLGFGWALAVAILLGALWYIGFGGWQMFQ